MVLIDTMIINYAIQIKKNRTLKNLSTLTMGSRVVKKIHRRTKNFPPGINTPSNTKCFCELEKLTLKPCFLQLISDFTCIDKMPDEISKTLVFFL